jgi:repressor LexA
MADIGKRIKEKRESLGMTQEELAAKLGYKNKSSIAKIETGTNDIVQSKVVEFANILDTTVAYLMGWENIPKSSKRKGVVINVLGRVAAGIPIEAVEDIIDTEEITESLARTGTFFGLQIHGDSMEPKMSEGDIVIVRQQNDAESGEIVIVTVNGTDATCKRLRKYRDGIELISTNPSYEPIFFTKEEVESKPVRIIGKVVELRAKF